MIGLIKFFAGVSVAVPLAGTLGGTFMSTSRAKQVAAKQKLPNTQESNIELPLTSNSVSNLEHSQQAKAQISELTFSESTDSAISISEQSSKTFPAEPLKTLEEREQFTQEEAEKGNCTIITPLRKIIEGVKENTSEYYSVSCVGKGVEGRDSEDTIPNKWEGIFPKSIFRDKNLVEDKKLEIKIREEDENFGDYDLGDDGEYVFKITFSGESFEGTKDSLLAGKWNDFDEIDFDSDEEDRALAKVKLVKPDIEKLIYLSWNKY